ncbi:hypothetical protein [Bradyrhizobium erythrophlei]|uniref:Uncharacterized protein n=1 Tax=Bradyrhizobium erythrophlei TaxID=1437360 RepID=A0A1M5XY86_9BRAD|nr:hypothetical protein [Bradyrhizobium erythrophlei]SHI04692.1 hypothetical protein SAMN05443248_7724 [Bradyrhizobium erythrophlei]
MAKIAPQNIDYRNRARRNLERARGQLNSNDDERLPYAVLELRFAMEAITYDRAQAFKDDLPYEEYSTWQPRKLVAVLAGIDPSIMKTSTLRIGIEDQPGVPSTNMEILGTEFVLTADDIKDHYDVLGGGLHIPTMAQFQKDKLPDPVILRARCDEIVSIIDRVLTSQVWNSTFNVSSHIDCFRCKTPMRRRLPHGVKTLKAVCFECKAEYAVKDEADGKVLWSPVVSEAPCANSDCTAKVSLWPDEIKPGTCWTCKECGVVSEISLNVGVKGAE